jgi:hypothetical protein
MMRIPHLARCGFLALTGLLAAAFLVPEVAAFQLAGTVVDPLGAPVKDVDLDIEDLLTGLTLVTPEDNTDGDGRFAIEVPAGLYRILFEPPPGLRLAPHVEPRVEVAGDFILDLTLQPGLSLAGRITGPDGVGVVGVDLDVWDRELQVKLPTPGDQTNALGFYSVILPPGTYDVVADPPFTTRLASVRFDSVTVSDEDQILSFGLDSGFILSGVIRSRDGRPTAGIDLDVTDLDSGAEVPLAEDKVDASGQYALVLRRGRYELGIDAEAASRLISTRVPELVIDADRTIDVELTPGLLVQGEVRDPGGSLVEGANLDFVDLASGLEVLTPSDFTNVLGVYAVVLPPGSFDLFVWPPVSARYPPDTTRTLEANRDLRLDLTFGSDDPPLPPQAPPSTVVLGPVFPNPTPDGATVPFELPAGAGQARITIVNAAGRVVRLLAVDAGSGGSAGSLFWDGRDENGRLAPTGVYFIRLSTGSRSVKRKLVVFRDLL